MNHANRLDLIFSQSKNAETFSEGYFKYLSEIFSRIDLKTIDQFIELLLNARENEKTIFFIGNGGSAATASHFANDLAIGMRLLPQQKPFKALSLTDNVAVMTAIANDDGYSKIFLFPLRTYLQPGDLVVAISASGNSPNIIEAVEYVKKQGNPVVGLTGFEGGKLKLLSDISVHVPSNAGEYGPVEDIHMIFDHLIMSYLYRFVRNEK